MPLTDTVGACWLDVNILGPVQLQVTLEVEELPPTVAKPEMQSMVSPTTETFGATISCVTITLSTEIQPFGPVTATW